MTYDPKAAAAALEAAGAMLNGTTEGPWELSDTWSYYRHQLYVEHDGAEIAHAASCDDRDNDAPESPAMDEALNNAMFIAWCREGVPALAAHLTAAMADNERLREALGWFLADPQFVVSVGGNPIVVEAMIAEAHALLEKP